jgi:integrase/recombinase XerD
MQQPASRHARPYTERGRVTGEVHNSPSVLSAEGRPADAVTGSLSRVRAHEAQVSTRADELGTCPVPGLLLDTSAEATADVLAARWLLSYAGATREAYTRDLRAWGSFLASVGVYDALEAGRPHVDAYVRAMEAEGRASSTIARRIASLSSFYRYCVDEDAVSRSPVRGRRPRVSDESPRLGLDRDGMRALLDAAGQSSVRDHALVCLLALNGLRVSEALGTDVTDLGLERGHRVLGITRKGGRRALVPLAPLTGAVLAELVEGRSEGPLFITQGGLRMRRQAAYKVVGRLARDAGIQGTISPHSLRHSFVTAALDAGASLRDVQDAAGHADPRTTRRYDRARHSLDRHPTYSVASSLG